MVEASLPRARSARHRSRRPGRFGMRAAVTLMGVVGASALLSVCTVSAQQAASAPAKPAVAAARPAAAKSASKPDGAVTGDAGLRQRVEQLEEQLVEIQVTVGTLDSLAKGGASSSSGVYRGAGEGASGAGGADAGRVAVLETQVRALASQLDQLSQALRQANARPPAAAAPAPASLPASAAAADASDPIGRLVNNGRVGAGASASANTAGPAPGPFGVVPQASAATASLPAAGASDASSKEAYEAAYGYLLQQDFTSAETAFDDFLRRFPADPLAGNAQYWLGETFFARGQYKPAATAFLKGYQTYARSPKAPDSVLKLGQSLDKLGQKDAACAAYSELATKFPNAPGYVKNRADAERRRLACA